MLCTTPEIKLTYLYTYILVIARHLKTFYYEGKSVKVQDTYVLFPVSVRVSSVSMSPFFPLCYLHENLFLKKTHTN